jgi:hypothetical protein
VGTAEEPPNYYERGNEERKVLKEFNLFSKKDVLQRFTKIKRIRERKSKFKLFSY